MCVRVCATLRTNDLIRDASSVVTVVGWISWDSWLTSVTSRGWDMDGIWSGYGWYMDDIWMIWSGYGGIISIYIYILYYIYIWIYTIYTYIMCRDPRKSTPKTSTTWSWKKWLMANCAATICRRFSSGFKGPPGSPGGWEQQGLKVHLYTHLIRPYQTYQIYQISVRSIRYLADLSELYCTWMYLEISSPN